MARYRKQPYVLFKQNMKDGSTVVWYYYVYDETGKRIIRSTGETDQIRAIRYCEKLLAENRLIPLKYPTLSEWAESRKWWQYDNCLYCKARLRRSDPDRPAISRRYADDCLRILRQKILPVLGDRRLDQITSQDCEDLLFSWVDSGHTRKSANSWASVLRVMMREAVRMGDLKKSPFDQVPFLVSSPKRRGILLLEEVQQLFNPNIIDTIWGNHIYYAVNLTAALSALRQGEVLALQTHDVFPDHLHVEHSWSLKYKLGPTKTKAVLEIPIPPFLYEEIKRYLNRDGFVFSFTEGRSPVTGNRVTEALYVAMEHIGITDQERKERNLTFHSWRHWWSTFLRSRGVPDAKIRTITGHKTQKMLEHYGSQFQLEDYREIYAVQDEVSRLLEAEKGNVVP